MVRVKICGITNELDAQRAAKAGAWAIGFIFHKKSPRFISPFKAKKIIESLPPFITPVGVFVNHNAGAMRDIINHCGLRAVQLHGKKTIISRTGSSGTMLRSLKFSGLVRILIPKLLKIIKWMLFYLILMTNTITAVQEKHLIGMY